MDMDGNRELMFIKSILLLLLILFFLSCLPDKKNSIPAPYPYNSELNSIRNEIGLKIIDSGFSSFNEKSLSTFTKIGDFYHDVSFYPKDSKKNEQFNKPYFYKKFVDLDSKSGKLISETDVFRSGARKYGVIFEDTIYESLAFKYFYEDFKMKDPQSTTDTSKFKKGDWEFSYSAIDTLKLTSSNRPELLKRTHWELKTRKVSKEAADSILNIWGLTRRHY